MMRFVIVILFLVLSVCSAGDPCPPEAELDPCRCIEIPIRRPARQHQESLTTTTTEESSTSTTAASNRRRRSTDFHVLGNDTVYTIVDCKNLKSIEVLAGAVSVALDRKLVDQLTVSNLPPPKEHAVARFPRGGFRRFRVRRFKILNSRLPGDFIWRERAFEGQERSLLWFTANNCSLSGVLTYNALGTVHTQGLNFIPSLQGVDFSDNLLHHIDHMSFRYPPTNLTTVILMRNSIESIRETTFAFIPLLRHVDLSHNLLASIGRNVFASPANNLEYMNLSWNSLTVLPADFFNNMPALKIVDISHNFFYTLAEKPWEPVWRNLTYVDVTGNFVGCNCELRWLVNILQPGEMVNGTWIPTQRPSTNQTIRGVCSKITEPETLPTNYELSSLTRDRLGC